MDEREKELMERLKAIRHVVERGFSPSTAAPGFPGSSPSTGQCAATALVVRELLGGDYVSASVSGHSHWFNRIPVESSRRDIDLTGDQFGFPQIQASEPGSLYPDTKIREPQEVTAETVDRAIQIADGAGLDEVAKRLRKWNRLYGNSD